MWNILSGRALNVERTLTEQLTIDRLGAQGDGIADGQKGPVFVPFTLPGEHVVASLSKDSQHAGLVELLTKSPDRIDPICPHFGACGGCALQHLAPHAYLAWKHNIVVQALRARGLSAEVEPVRGFPLGARRRAAFALIASGAAVTLGYRRPRSHDVIGIDVCPILAPGIVARLPALRALLAPLLGSKREARVVVTLTDSGLDVVLEGVHPNKNAWARLAREAGVNGIARISAGHEDITIAVPALHLGDAKVRLPPGAFLQASHEAETEMAALVRDGVGKAKRIADLFSGLGTFSFVLARRAKVDAYETDGLALAALGEAARHTPKLKPIKTVTRDLFRDPLGWQELTQYDAVVFDPPRAGAAAQAAQLAKSKVKRVVAVSCNPATLARDLRLLVDGGYQITRIVPVDQFLFSSHVEIVAHLER